ncbi:hypothetical protein OCGS_2419 [Oceaniovalibus guishaninsula JLT2003]|uniref:Uncharacterized protein n=1 Tax=Oceaniovalibus guishaninsula JLT2003 TaxID=1231392 RepID=K2HAL3_9RHOB|nr:hypothetical protein [Oceaniovalibus guishaninsula]EKE43687.1 hypothetical protein OCGS_2419 [Oceaniovalibus guishaninsula JLT2003]
MSVWIRLRRWVLGRGLWADAERNSRAADRLDAALKEVFRR